MPGNFLLLMRPELLVLLPALFLIGLFLRRSSHSDRSIALILGAVSVITSLCFLLAGHPEGGAPVILAGLTEGFFLAAAVCYAGLLVCTKCRRKPSADSAAPTPCENCDCDDCMWFKVQICASKSQSTAEDLAVRLRKDGYNAYVVADRQA